MALLSPCLLILDHVHFQYNGMLLGVLLASVATAMNGQHLLAAFLFTCLLWLKHVYLVIAPLFFVYLLRHYCFEGDGDRDGPSTRRTPAPARRGDAKVRHDQKIAEEEEEEEG